MNVPEKHRAVAHAWVELDHNDALTALSAFVGDENSKIRAIERVQGLIARNNQDDN